jgi:hypothetical protein
MSATGSHFRPEITVSIMTCQGNYPGGLIVHRTQITNKIRALQKIAAWNSRNFMLACLTNDYVFNPGNSITRLAALIKYIPG